MANKNMIGIILIIIGLLLLSLGTVLSSVIMSFVSVNLIPLSFVITIIGGLLLIFFGIAVLAGLRLK